MSAIVASQLLCTFAKKWNLEDTLNTISNAYDIVFNKIFVLENAEHDTEYFCTYNVNKGAVSTNGGVRKTISIHRKKETNTLYTINSLNEVIRLQNNGRVDYSFKINWDEFRSSLLVTNSLGELKVIPTKLSMIVDT